MKNKALTYGLLALVLLIWGYVLYKVFGAVQGDDPPTPGSKRITTGKEDLGYYNIKEYHALSLDYRDPMYHKDRTGNLEDTNSPDLPDAYANSYAMDQHSYEQVPEPEPLIEYLGYIENEVTKKRVAILNLEGKQLLIGVKESKEGLYVLDIDVDNVRIKYLNKTKTISK